MPGLGAACEHTTPTCTLRGRPDGGCLNQNLRTLPREPAPPRGTASHGPLSPLPHPPSTLTVRLTRPPGRLAEYLEPGGLHTSPSCLLWTQLGCPSPRDVGTRAEVRQPVCFTEPNLQGQRLGPRGETQDSLPVSCEVRAFTPQCDPTRQRGSLEAHGPRAWPPSSASQEAGACGPGLRAGEPLPSRSSRDTMQFLERRQDRSHDGRQVGQPGPAVLSGALSSAP